MSELNFKPDASQSYAGDKQVPVPALDGGSNTATTSRLSALGRVQRRRVNTTRLQFTDSGFRLFRVY